jgi:integrase
MPVIKLTKTIVENTLPGAKDIILRDSEVTGLELKITPAGRRIYQVYYRNAAGKPRRPRLGTHGTMTLTQAREQARIELGKVADGKDPSGEKKELRAKAILLRVFWERFLADRQNRWTARTMETMGSLWTQHIEPRMGDLPLSAVSTHEVAALHNAMSAMPTTANRALQLLRSMINQARDWELFVGENPASKIRPYPERARETFLSPQQLVKLLEAIREEELIGGKAAVGREETDDGQIKEVGSRGITPWQASLFRLLIATGARLREIMDARWEYVDWKACALRLPKSKTGKKTIWLNTLAMKELENLRAISRNPVWIIEGRIRGSHLVNSQKPWDRVRYRACRNVEGKVVDKTLQKLRIHDLRHSFASFGIEAGLDLFRVGKALGHSQARTTARYAHIVDESVKEASERVGTVIRGHIEGKPVGESEGGDSPQG